MFAQKHTVTLTGSTAGAVTGYTPVLNGALSSVRYSSGGTLSSTALLTIANEGTDETMYSKALGSAAATVRPRMAVCRSTGTTVYNTTGTANPVVDYGVFANERAALTIGKTTATGVTGTFILHLI